MKSTILGLLTLLALSLAAPAQAAGLYAATAAGAAGRLYKLDPATGALLQDIGPLNDVAGANYPITGLAFHPTTGVLYGSTGNSAAATAARLVTIDPATGLVSPVGSFNAGPVNSSGTPATMADLEFDAAGTLYGVGSIGGPQLYSINTTTAQATAIGGTGLTSTTGGGLGILGGTFYGTPTSARFGTYDSGTGAYTDIGNPTKPSGGGYGSLAVSGGLLYGLNVGSGSPPPTNLVTINPANAAVTVLGASPNSVDAIAFQIPEPGTAVLAIGPAIVAMLARRRR